MLRISRYRWILQFLCVCSILVCAFFIIFPDALSGGVNKETTTQYEILKKRHFIDEQINNMSLLSRWLLSSEGSPPPSILNAKKEPYLILIWDFGPLLERRHIKRFTNNKYSPWENCSAKNCMLSYKTGDLIEANAVVFHLHRTRSVSDLPSRVNRDQRWIFLTDESPIHTFLGGNQKLSNYNGIFNWSMSYRMDSDVPVPYGRTISKSFDGPVEVEELSKDSIVRSKAKLVAIMGSNCRSNNERWAYVSELKELLGEDLHIYGHCLHGNLTACPGHFERDCAALNVYKFYLAFENSNCKEYLTEKVFWHGYHKSVVPIIMGAPRKDCERLLPPYSFLHVTDFANPSDLANYLKYLNRHDDEYLKLHEWRKYYRVINEHGYFGSPSRHYCRICEALHYNPPTNKVYEDVEAFWNVRRDCGTN